MFKSAGKIQKNCFKTIQLKILKWEYKWTYWNYQKQKTKPKLIINIEHQSTTVDKIKIKVIDDYKNQSKCQYKLPLLSVIVSPFPKEQHVSEYKSTDSDILQPIYYN